MQLKKIIDIRQQNMEQFSLEKYLAKPSRKLVTRHGKRARIICMDRRDLEYPIIALIETRPGGGEVAYSYTKDGMHYTDCFNIFDLFFVPEKREGWVNVYKNIMGQYEAGIVYDNEEDAKKHRHIDGLATSKIEWEE